MDYKSAYLEIGEMVFVYVGVGYIGCCSIIASVEEKGIADDFSYVIRVKEERSYPYYLAFYLQTQTTQNEIRRLARVVGTTEQISLMREIPVLEPEPEKLSWFK